MKYIRKDFPKDFRVLCKTKEEAKELIIFLNNELDIHFRYGNDGFGIKNPTYWHEYKHNTLYCIENKYMTTRSAYWHMSVSGNTYKSFEDFQKAYNLKEVAYEIY